MVNHRNRYSALNAITAMGLTIVNGLLGIVVTKFVISSFGSDFNGLNSTANQIVNMLLILEGGFTLASNVALFKPLNDNNLDLVNSILAATKNKFKKIGLLFLSIGMVISVVYSFFVKSSLPQELVITVVLMTIVPSAFNLYYATTYRVLLQGQQKEFVINIITMLTVGLGHIANVVMIFMHGQMWMVRFNTMIFSFANSLLIALYVRRKNRFINLKAEPHKEYIKGTNDVMIQKITGVIYNSAPIVFLSVSSSGGTALASVYAVYNSIFVMVKSLLHGVIDAPRHSFGQLIAERDREKVYPVFAQYEFIAFFAIFIMLTTCCTLILPFIKIYTYGITDTNYFDPFIAVMMVLISTTEMIHIPSGHLINMAGEFKISRNFQLIGCVVLLISMITGGSIFGVYGMLAALLCTAILLAVLEIGYVHIKFFKSGILNFFKTILPLIVFGFITCFIEMKLPLTVTGYFKFLIYAIIFVIINTVIGLIVSFIFNRKQLFAMFSRIKLFIKK